MTARRLGEEPLVEAAFAALLGSEAWALLDTVGAQFQWWHWHSSEPIYDDREAGVPVASAFWIMSSCGSLALALRPCPDAFYWGIVAGPVAYLGLMNLPFVALFHPIVTYGRHHALYAMWALRAICALPLLRRLALPRRPDLSLLLQTLLFVGGVGALSLCDPTQETRTSFGQPCASEGVTSLLTGSPCAVVESSFWGAFRRKKFVCAGQDSRDLFRVCDARCASAPRDGELWYQSCGVPIATGFYGTVGGHALLVLLLALVPFRAVARAAPVEGFKLPERYTEGWAPCPDGDPGYIRARPKGE